MEKSSLQKETFFNELYKLDESDKEEDSREPAFWLTWREEASCDGNDPETSLPKHRLIHTSLVSQPLGRTISAPLPCPKALPENVEVIEDTPVSSAMPRKETRARKRVNNAVPSILDAFPKSDPPKPGPIVRGKRKRGRSVEAMPKSQQIFQGLSFYFFPNNDISPARRARIRKAMEWGAIWVKDWKDGITHVIADNSLCYDDLLSFLKIPALPPGISLVDELYPADCIKFRFVVNPDHVLYHVKGHQQAAKPPRSSDPKAAPGLPLPVEQGKREVFRQAHTLSRTEASESRPSSRGLEGDEAVSEPQVIEGTPIGHGEYLHDALDEAIEEARVVKDLPLDFEDESPSSVVASDESDGSSSERSRKRPKVKKGSFDKAWQQKFSCMQKHDGVDKAGNPNIRTIEVLQQMANYYDRTKDHWRLTAYRRALAALRKETRKILTKEEACTIPFIGERLAAKIEEIVWTDRLRRLENASLESNDRVLQEFMKIYGVGYAQASIWVDQGHRSLEDLLKKVPLTKNQKVGIDHYSDFLQRIPRSEAAEHERLVCSAIHAIDPTIEVTIGGSYRRGALDCGDIDFIVTKPDCSPTTLRTIIIDTIVPQLFASDYLKVGLAVTSQSTGSKWHGASCLPHSTIWRRIDFLLVPWEEMGAALIYFTGNDIFNRSIRLLASKKGMRLNQRGLWRDVMREDKRQRITQGTLVEGRSEERIFEVLGVPWRAPEHRIC